MPKEVLVPKSLKITESLSDSVRKIATEEKRSWNAQAEILLELGVKAYKEKK